MDERYTSRSEILREADKIITADRNKTYGEPDEDFQRIAGMWNVLGFQAPDGEKMQGHHVALAMVALKLSRLTWSAGHRDSWMDVAGYAACGYETAQLEEMRRNSKTFAPGKLEEPVSIVPSAAVIYAAQEALNMEPETLHNMGLMLRLTRDVDECGDVHSLQPPCSYRVVARRDVPR